MYIYISYVCDFPSHHHDLSHPHAPPDIIWNMLFPKITSYEDNINCNKKPLERVNELTDSYQGKSSLFRSPSSK